MEPTFVETDDDLPKKVDYVVAAALAHKTALLRLRNWLRCPLLQLPTETFVQILSYIMEDPEHPHAWRPIFSTCYRIHTTMSTTTDLWRKADFSVDRTAHLAFARSAGNLHEITVAFWSGDNELDWSTQAAMDFCRDNLVLNGYGLHTVDITGFPPDVPHWSWIFERPLPRLNRLKIHFFPSDEDAPFMPAPVDIQLPTDLPLRVLDLQNAKLPWSSNLFTGLTELHLDFSNCHTSTEIPEDDLLRILSASPRLERLSLVDLRPTVPGMDEPQLAPTRTIRLPSLIFLKVDHLPEIVAPILSHLDTPAIASFEIHSQVSNWEVELYLDSYFPDDHLLDRVLPNPPIFEVWTRVGGGFEDSMIVKIGSAEMRFDFDMDERDLACANIMACIHPFVPTSVTTIELGYTGLDEEGWSEFFSVRPEIRSIESTKDIWPPATSDTLWDALSATSTDTVPLCPKLESVSIYHIPDPASLLNCLRSRKNAGCVLRRLKLWGVDGAVAKEFSSLVEELQILSKPVRPTERVRLASMDQPDMC